MSIAERIFYRNLYRQAKKSRSFPDFEKVKTVLLVFESDAEERNTQIMQLAKELREAGKKVMAWGYTDKKKALTQATGSLRILSREDFGWFQRMKKEILTTLRANRYDLLIDLSLHNDLPTRYMALWADASFKTGRHTGEEHYIHDFMIELPEGRDAAYLFDQIIYYLKNIGSND